MASSLLNSVLSITARCFWATVIVVGCASGCQSVRVPQWVAVLMDPATELAKSNSETVFEPHDLREEIEVHLANEEIFPAIADLELLLTLTPDDAENWYLLAELQDQVGMMFEAEKSVDSALEVHPRHLAALMLKADLERHQGLPTEALTYYLRIIELDPKNVPARLLVGSLEIELFRSESAAPLMRELCQSPHASQEQKNKARWLLGIAYGGQRRWEDAAESLQLALEERDITTAEEWYRLAYAQWQAGLHNELPRSLHMALQHDTEHPGASQLTLLLQSTQQVNPVGFSQPGSSVVADQVPIPQYW